MIRWNFSWLAPSLKPIERDSIKRNGITGIELALKSFLNYLFTRLSKIYPEWIKFLYLITVLKLRIIRRISYAYTCLLFLNEFIIE